MVVDDELSSTQMTAGQIYPEKTDRLIDEDGGRTEKVRMLHRRWHMILPPATTGNIGNGPGTAVKIVPPI